MPKTRADNPDDLSYTAGDRAVLVARVCALSIEVARELLSDSLSEEALQSTIASNVRILPAIQIASPSLYNACTAWLHGKKPKNRKFLQKLASVLLRMATRATPLGTYATVSTIDQTDARPIELRPHVIISSRPDMAWLHSMITELERHESSWQHLQLFTNDAYTIRGEWLHILNFRKTIVVSKNGYVTKEYSPTSLRLTGPVKHCLTRAQMGIRATNLADELAATFQVSFERSLSLIRTLWNAGLLISELQPDLLSSPWADFKESIAAKGLSYGLLPSQLERLDSMLSRLNAAQVEAWDFSVLPQTRALMAEILSSVSQESIGENIPTQLSGPRDDGELGKSSIAADVQIDARQNILGRLPENVVRDATLLGELILRGSPAISFENYRRRFIEQYEGATRHIPILELLDEDLGIGPPSMLETEPSFNSRAMLNLISQSLRSNQGEVDLSPDDIETLFPRSLNQRFPRQLELGFQVLACSREDLELGRYTVSVSNLIGATSPARTSGRFLDMLDGEHSRRLLATKSSLVSDSELQAELSFVPTRPRLWNVSARPTPLPYRIRLGHAAHACAEDLSVEDLYIGIDENTRRFYAYSKSKGKRVRIHCGTALNVAPEPALVRFLYWLDQDLTRDVAPFPWGGLADAPYLPRIRHANIILSPRKWTVDSQIWRAKPDIESAIESWRADWDVPKLVLLCDHDNKLPVNLESPLSRSVILDEVGRKKHLVFEEALNLSNQWLSDGNERFVAEFVLNLSRKSKAHNDHVVSVSAAENRNFVPGELWTYIKFYCGGARAETLLTKQLRNFVARLQDQGYLRKWFFVRYNDKRRHLRVRFEKSSQQIDIVRDIIEFARSVTCLHLANHFSLDTYERELERYGNTAMELAEELFWRDSESVLNMLSSSPYGAQQRFVDAVKTALPLVKAFIKDDDPRLWLGMRFESPSGYRLQPIDREMIRAMMPDLAGSDLQLFVAPVEKYRRADEQGAVPVPLPAILRSLIHMHFNRCGLETGEQEDQASAILREVFVGSWLRSHAGQNAQVTEPQVQTLTASGARLK